jgi:c-di-GMP-binding flagellar brake protein YcgR
MRIGTSSQVSSEAANNMTSSNRDAGAPIAGKMLHAQAELEEIAVLEALAVEGEAIVAKLGSGKLMFRSRLRFVDPERLFIIVEPSTDAASNAALLAHARASFFAEVDEWRIEFIAEAPRKTIHDGITAIELRFPESITSHRRRMYDRVPVPAESPVRCVVYNKGVASFEGSMMDISEGGVGMMQYDPDMPLDPGMVLKNCCIERPGREKVIVDLEVRFTELVTLANGSRARRAGCRFLNRSPASIALIEELAGKQS